MIKLIASDLDGTLLLNHAQSLNPGTAKLIHELTKQGRILPQPAAASIRIFTGCSTVWRMRLPIFGENGALDYVSG